MIHTALSVIPKALEKQPVILPIDDTMIEKYGKKFENCSKMFDHAAYNGSNYLNGHCFVSLLLSALAEDEHGKQYLSIPIGYRMWTKEKSKLETAADGVERLWNLLTLLFSSMTLPLWLCQDFSDLKMFNFILQSAQIIYFEMTWDFYFYL